MPCLIRGSGSEAMTLLPGACASKGVLPHRRTSKLTVDVVRGRGLSSRLGCWMDERLGFEFPLNPRSVAIWEGLPLCLVCPWAFVKRGSTSGLWMIAIWPMHGPFPDMDSGKAFSRT